jgi:hypothetical protein
MGEELPKAERQMVARARHAFTRLVGLELGDKMADEVFEARVGARR